MTVWAVLRILLMTQEVVDEFSWNFSEGGTSHELDPEISFNENLTTVEWGQFRVQLHKWWLQRLGSLKTALQSCAL